MKLPEVNEILSRRGLDTVSQYTFQRVNHSTQVATGNFLGEIDWRHILFFDQLGGELVEGRVPGFAA
jgi:hypothetical protein